MGRRESRFIERASWLLRLPLDTPTIPFEDEATGCTLWLKLDYLLPSGCTKDRMATSIVAHAIATGEVVSLHRRGRGVERFDVDRVGHGLRHRRGAVSGVHAQDGQRGAGLDDPPPRRRRRADPSGAGNGRRRRRLARGFRCRGGSVRRPTVREPAQRVRPSALDGAASSSNRSAPGCTASSLVSAPAAR